MPNPLYATPWSPRLNFIIRGPKPTKRRLPGLRIVVRGPGVWRCCFPRVYSN